MTTPGPSQYFPSRSNCRPYYHTELKVVRCMKPLLHHDRNYAIYVFVLLIASMFITMSTLSHNVSMSQPPAIASEMQLGRIIQQSRVVYNARYLNSACAHVTKSVSQIQYTNINRQIYTVDKHNLAMCVVPKSGCSFLKQLVYFLNDPGDLQKSNLMSGFQMNERQRIDFVDRFQRSIFNISRQDIHHVLDFEPVLIDTKEFAAKNTSLKVIATRNPYSRLYSAYIDKIYLPLNWAFSIKKYNAKLQRKGLTDGDICQAKFESFENFLENIIEDSGNQVADAHWTPASALCEPCAVKPDLIIRQESFNNDVDMLLRSMNLTKQERETIYEVIAKRGIQSKSTLHGLIETMYSRAMHDTKDCFTKMEIARRVWKALQIQGQIYNSSPFPKDALSNITLMDTEQVSSTILTKMFEMPITAEESHEQRTRALARAYRNVKPELLLQIQAVYYYDFVIFGYDFHPPKYEDNNLFE